jgi:hypothetical protein
MEMMKTSPGHIEPAVFKRAVDYLRDNLEGHLGLIGGEPTLHPRFIELLDYTLDRGMDVLVFTNGRLSADLARDLAQRRSAQLNVLLNLNDPDFYARPALDRIEHTLAELGDMVRLGYTVYRLPFDLDFHRRMILEHGLKKQIRLGLASPLLDRDDQHYVPDREMGDVGRHIMDNVEMLEKDDVLIGFDCGFSMCLFTTEQLGLLAEKALGFNSLCRPIIDIDLDLKAHCCFPLTGVMTVSIEDFPRFRDLVGHFETKMASVKVFGNQGQCLNCKYLRRNQCRGWCVGRIATQDKDLIRALGG